MAQHTPGPWRQGGRLLDITAHGTTIATVNCPSQHPATEATAQANARLIAAAPELLEALKGAVEALEAMPPDYIAAPYTHSRLYAARLAIAKAEGQP